MKPAFLWVGVFLLVLAPLRADTGKIEVLGNERIPPMAFLEDGVPHGLVVDLFQAMAGSLPPGTELRLLNWQEAQALVSSGQADALVQINRTPERELLYDFSAPLLESRFAIFVRVAQLGISSLGDLAGRQVGVEAAGLPRQLLDQQGTAKLVIVKDFASAFVQLADGQLDAVVVDQRVGEYVLATQKIGGVKTTGLPVSTSFSAFAVRKGNTALLQQINVALATIRADGTYAKILANWDPTEVIYQTKAQRESQQSLSVALLLAVALVLSVLWALVSHRNLRRARKAEAALLAELVQQSRLERELASREKQLDGMLQNSQDAIGVHHKGVWELVNPAMARLFGASSPGELVGTSVLEVFAPEARARVLELSAARAREGRRAETAMTVGQRRDGSHFDMEIALSEYEQDDKTMVMVLIRDISDRLRQERELRDSEERYRLLITASNDPVVLHQEGRIVYVNPAGLRLFGARTEDELIGTPILDRVHPEDLELVKGRIQQVMSNQPASPAAERFLRLDGSSVDVEVSGGRVVLAGKPSVLVLVRELTERNQARLRQESLLRRYQTILQASRDGIHILAADGSVVDVNPAFCDLLGYNREELLTMSVADWDAQWTVQPGTFVTKHRRRDGTLLDIEVSCVGIELEGGAYFCASARDLTERMLLERKLQKEQRLESLGVLAGGIAHDINNVLAGLSGQVEVAQLFLRDGNPDQALSRLERVPAVVERGRSLSRRLLTFSKGGLPTRAPLSLAGPLAEWLDFVLTGTDLRGNLEIQPELWNCQGDLSQLGQAISNLLINARQASPPGGTITLRAMNRYDTRPWVTILVSDEGPGIPAEAEDKIFDPFFTTKSGGTGLGLSVAYSVIQQHEGTLRLQSAGGPGATFVVEIPADPLLPSDAKASPVLDFTDTGVVVVLDDESLIREALSVQLASLGYEVLQASDGHEVLRLTQEVKVQGREVRLYLLDGLIPQGLGGQATLDRLRSDGVETPVVLMSGYFDALTQAGVTEDRRVVRLAKPFTQSELVQVLRILLT